MQEGLQTINNFSVWISKTSNPDYYDCLFSEAKPGCEFIYYVNIHKDSRLPIEFKYPPKPIKTKKKNEEEEEVVSETITEQIYRVEHSAYTVRKELGQPLWLLHSSTLKKILEALKTL